MYLVQVKVHHRFIGLVALLMAVLALAGCNASLGAGFMGREDMAVPTATPLPPDPEALRYFEQGIKHLKQFEESRNMLGQSEALKAFDQAIEIGGFAEVHYQRAKVYLDGGYWGDERIIADLDTAIYLRPDFAEAYFERFRFLFDRTARQKQRLVFMNKSTPEYEQALSDIEQDEAQYLSDLDQSIELKPDYFDALVARADLYESANRQAESLADLSAAAKAVPEDAEPQLAYRVYFTHASMQADAGQWDEVITSCTGAIVAMPESAEAYFLRGTAFENTGDVAAMLSDYEQAIALHPPYQGKLYRTLSRLEKLLAGLENGSSHHGQLGALISKIKGNGVGLSSSNAEALSYYGQGLEYLKKFEMIPSQEIYWDAEHGANADAAVWLFTNALMEDSAFLEAYVQRAKAYMLKSAFPGIPEMALADLSYVTEIQPGYVVAYLERGKILGFWQKKWDEGIAELSQGLLVQPDHFETLVTRAAFYLQQEKPAEAEADLLKAAVVMPGDVAPYNVYHFHVGRGHLALLQDKPLEVITELEAAFEIVDTLNPDAFFQLYDLLLPLQAGLLEFAPGSESHTQLEGMIKRIQKHRALRW